MNKVKKGGKCHLHRNSITQEQANLEPPVASSVVDEVIEDPADRHVPAPIDSQTDASTEETTVVAPAPVYGYVCVIGRSGKFYIAYNRVR